MRPFHGTPARRSVLLRLAATLALLGRAARGVAQEPRGMEAGIVVTTARAAPAFSGGGASVGIRPGGRTRIVLNLMPGEQGSRLAGRGELLGQLMLTPAKGHGAGFYGSAGIAGQVGRRDAGWLVLGVGIEGTPAGRSGWHLEAGIGGGVRFSAGWRWRWLHAAGAEPP